MLPASLDWVAAALLELVFVEPVGKPVDVEVSVVGLDMLIVGLTMLELEDMPPVDEE